MFTVDNTEWLQPYHGTQIGSILLKMRQAHIQQKLDVEQDQAPTEKARTRNSKHINQWAADKLASHPEIEIGSPEVEINLKKRFNIVRPARVNLLSFIATSSIAIARDSTEAIQTSS